MQSALAVILVGAVILITVAVPRARAKVASRKSQAKVMRGLRLQAIETEPPAAAGDEAWAVVMDIGFPAATASVLGSDGGDASLYLSNGGGDRGDRSCQRSGGGEGVRRRGAQAHGAVAGDG